MFFAPIACLALSRLAFDPVIEDAQRRAVAFFWEQSNSTNGFTKDRASNKDIEDTHTIASCASVGFALIAYPIGVEHKWLTRDQALERTKTTLSHLLTDWQQEHGWLYHFVDWRDGRRQWQCEASSIDTSLCLAGILFAERYWHDPDVTRLADRFEKRLDWNWMLTDDGARPRETHLCMGWHPENGFLGARWADYDECKFLYIQAYGLTDIPDAGWDTIRRPLEHYGGIDFITGGPLFMHEMSEGFYDFRALRDRLGFDYEVAERNAALANRQFCIDNPGHYKAYGPDFWGLNACDGPDGYNAFGTPGNVNDDGTVCPTAPLAAINVVPKEALSFVHAFRENYPNTYGRYGFPDSLNPSRSWIDDDVLGLDLGMMLCATENYRNGFLWKLNMANPVIRRGFERAGLRKAKPDPRLQITAGG